MHSPKAQNPPNDRQLWLLAFCVSVLLNLLLFSLIGIQAIRFERSAQAFKPKPKAPSESVVEIFPEMFEKPEQITPPEKPPEAAPKFARSTAEQESKEPLASRRYIGERNTRATSDRAPSAEDPNMPSQAGRKALPDETPETTESRYQDGALDQNPTPLLPEDKEPQPEQTKKGEASGTEGELAPPKAAEREKLLDGPHPTDIAFSKNQPDDKEKAQKEQKAAEGTPDSLANKKSKKQEAKPKPRPISDPAFAGNQKKTAIQGSISRTGRSALDVVDSPMGRYQAQISRAVELEWQRNCVKHRDFIMPGLLTVRFFVAADGRVKTVQFIGDSQTGEVQKGFTLNSIRNAPIPPMPPAVKKEMAGDSLELIFNFYF